jgi:hypothetical protein
MERESSMLQKIKKSCSDLTLFWICFPCLILSPCLVFKKRQRGKSIKGDRKWHDTASLNGKGMAESGQPKLLPPERFVESGRKVV